MHSINNVVKCAEPFYQPRWFVHPAVHLVSEGNFASSPKELCESVLLVANCVSSHFAPACFLSPL